MKALAHKLVEELTVETAFTIGGKIQIAESVVITWVVMAIITFLCIWLTRNMKVRNPGKRQLAAEFIVNWLDSFTGDMLGEHALQYREYMSTVLLFIGFANIIGVFGVKPPTKDMNVTIALSLMSIILIEAAGIRAKGGKGWLRSFTEPIAIVTPINILEVFIRPLSLCMRLFGNVLGAFVIMELIKMLVPVGLPVVFSLYFDFFDGLIPDSGVCVCFPYIFVHCGGCGAGCAQTEEGQEGEAEGCAGVRPADLPSARPAAGAYGSSVPSARKNRQQELTACLQQGRQQELTALLCLRHGRTSSRNLRPAFRN